MPSNFVNLEITRTASDFAQRVYDSIRTRYPDWEPADAGLETWLIDGFSYIAEELADLITTVGAEVFRLFGEEIVNVPPTLAARASVLSTWTLNDDDGHTIPAGTEVALTSADGTLAGFRVTEDVVVPNGETTTDAGAVTLLAIDAGAEYNDLGDPATLISAMSFVDPGGIDIVGDTGGGADAEDPLDYLNRLAERLQLLSETLVLPRDYEIYVRDFAGVMRAKAVDGYDAVAETYDNDRTVTIFPHGVDGDPLSTELKDEIKAGIEERREVNFVVYVEDPEYNTVAVTATVKAFETYDLAAVDAAVTAALESYLAPENWGRISESGIDAEWYNETTVRRRELESTIDRVPGVRYVSALTFSVNAGANNDSDKALTGAAPLTEPGTMSITVN